MGILIDPTLAEPDRGGMVKPSFETLSKISVGIGSMLPARSLRLPVAPTMSSRIYSARRVIRWPQGIRSVN